MGGTYFKGGGRAPLAPRWRRPWTQVTVPLIPWSDLQASESSIAQHRAVLFVTGDDIMETASCPPLYIANWILLFLRVVRHERRDCFFSSGLWILRSSDVVFSFGNSRIAVLFFHSKRDILETCKCACICCSCDFTFERCPRLFQRQPPRFHIATVVCSGLEIAGLWTTGTTPLSGASTRVGFHWFRTVARKFSTGGVGGSTFWNLMKTAPIFSAS